MKIAIVGATGLVGSKFIQILQEKNIKAEYYLYSSSKSAGKKIKVFNEELEVLDLALYDNERYDYALFSAGGDISRIYSPLFSEAGAIVIDNSSAFRMEKEIPLIVPEVNKDKVLEEEQGIIANPNCSTIQLVQVLHQLRKISKIKRVVVSTYQSVSGAGLSAMKELENDSISYLKNEKESKENFSQGIAFNCIPQIDVAMENGYTKEEMKMINETSKIMGEDIKITATCVRVPVMNCHAESVNIEFEDEIDLKNVKQVLKNDPNISILDNIQEGVFPTSREGSESNKTLVGRIREDFSKENSINLWIVSDNLRKGAALNAIQILEVLLKKKMS